MVSGNVRTRFVGFEVTQNGAVSENTETPISVVAIWRLSVTQDIVETSKTIRLPGLNAVI
jgi:hypothetical protein